MDASETGVGSIYRQGDILLRRVARLPGVLAAVPRDAGRIVLAYGEVTGHAHAIDAPEAEATLLTADQNQRFLRLLADVDLRHEEHATIHLPAGTYAVIQQRVWTDAASDEEEDRWRYAGD
ncbi:MAG: hypothetical protein MUQ32_04905 [Chloroflexi bacterium]|nr:hypothetical protein [Chloroflexota bacterium]